MGIDAKNGPWAEKYERMVRECPQNDLERQISKMLSEGGSIIECREVWKENGKTEEEFFAYLERLRRWEIEHLCVKIEDK